MPTYHFLVVTITCIQISAAQSSSQYPGTPLRPILSEVEAEQLTKEKYLGDWSPEEVKVPETTQYSVGNGEKFRSIQDAVNAVLNEQVNETERQYIFIEDGVYEETVFIPAASFPLTLYGTTQTKITLNQTAGMTTAAWIDQVNPNGTRYQEGDPAYFMYSMCVKKDETKPIGTRCTAVVWNKGRDTQIVNITIQNSAVLLEDAQAVALRADNDIILESVKLLGHQDTFYVNSGRTLVNNSYIEGDTDYVFGDGVAVFRNCTFMTVDDRRSGGVVFASKTAALEKYGFLVLAGRFEGSAGQSNVRLGRAWDTTSDYVPGESPNGEILIRDSWIGAVYNKTAPWGAAATSNRQFSGNIHLDRDLNDNNYNRCWEYNNVDISDN